MAWTTLHMQATTPLFNNGAEGDAGIRVPSIRGAMRFWLRALVGAVVGPDLGTLAQIERRVFGGPEHTSPLAMRIVGYPSVTTDTVHWGNTDNIRSICYLLGPGLADARGPTLLRAYVPPGATFRLQLRLPPKEAAAQLALAALWLLCAYGGVGARARRGLGGLRIDAVDGPVPAPWSEGALVSPTLDHYRALVELWPKAGALFDVATELARSARSWASQRPTYPVIGAGHTHGGISTRQFASWSEALGVTGDAFKEFRKGIPNSRRDAVLSRTSPAYPVGALGLPVVYRQAAVNAVGGDPGRPEQFRRASPLWLRAVSDDDSGWHLFSFAFLSEFLPTNRRPDRVALIQNRRQARKVTVRDTDVDRLTRDWVAKMQT